MKLSRKHFTTAAVATLGAAVLSTILSNDEPLNFDDVYDISALNLNDTMYNTKDFNDIDDAVTHTPQQPPALALFGGGRVKSEPHARVFYVMDTEKPFKSTIVIAEQPRALFSGSPRFTMDVMSDVAYEFNQDIKTQIEGFNALLSEKSPARFDNTVQVFEVQPTDGKQRTMEQFIKDFGITVGELKDKPLVEIKSQKYETGCVLNVVSSTYIQTMCDYEQGERSVELWVDDMFKPEPKKPSL